MNVKNKVYIIVLALFSLGSSGFIQAQTTWCNPVDIDYQYGEIIPKKRSNFKNHPPVVSRESADPVFINHQVKGQHEAYYLFSTSARGYWRSEDLVQWERIVPTGEWPVSYFKEKEESTYTENWKGKELFYKDMIAPAAISAKDTLFLLPSSRIGKSTVFYSTNPAGGEWAVYEESLTFPKLADGNIWDPGLYYEQEKDEWYIYWGSSNLFPIYGTQLTKENKNNTHLDLDSRLKSMIYLYPDQHGWERFGRDHTSKMHPYIEGPEVDKHKDTYYLTYAAPGTSQNMYGNGVYTSKSPMGPWVYALNNPIAYKPGGFLNGAGHGNLFQDKYGNYWNTGTSWIGVNWVFERRIVMLPAGFDQDGLLHANSRFADFPHYQATQKWAQNTDLFTGWMLLSFGKKVTTSSQKSEELNGKYLTDENPRTYWVAADNQAGESAVIDLEEVCQIHAVQINYTDYLQHNLKLLAPYPTRGDMNKHLDKVYTHYKMYASVDGDNWFVIADNAKEKINRSNPYVELEKPVKARFVKFENRHVPNDNLAVSDIRIFGKGNGDVPSSPKIKALKRDADQRNAMVNWQPVKGAVGYNILWGIAPDKLYSCYQVWANQPTEKEIRALNVGIDYYFAIEAFNENGVSNISEIKKCQ